MTPRLNTMVRNGWTLYKFVSFGERYDALEREVETLAQQHPDGFESHPKAKLLGRINEIIFNEIPADPTAPKYRQGKTLGSSNKDWHRAKFLGRFRLFFRFHSRERIIIYCWVSDENSLRKEGASTDPYEAFSKMIKAGHPPGGWEDLKRAVIGGPGKPPLATPWS